MYTFSTPYVDDLWISLFMEENTILNCRGIQMSVQDPWEQVLKIMQKQMQQISYDTWIRTSQVMAVSENRLVLGIQDVTGVQIMRQRYSQMLIAAVREAYGRNLDVVLTNVNEPIPPEATGNVDPAGQLKMCIRDSLQLVQADEGPKHRHIHHLIGGGQRFHGLAGHLAQALPGDQRLAAITPGHSLRDAHHVPAHEHGTQFVRTLFMDFHLNLGKRHYMHHHAVSIFSQNAGQLKDLFLGPLAGVGQGAEVYRLHMHPPVSYTPLG